MKKFVALLLMVTITLVPMFAFAYTTTEDALWALSTNQHVTGILGPEKVEEYLGPQNPAKPYIRGFLENGLVREKGLQSFVASTSGQLGGFTSIRTTVKIFSQYEEVVAEVVEDTLGYVPNGALDYIMATMYFEDKNVGHKFFKTNVPTWNVGTITVNKTDTFNLYMGDWDFDGEYDLGFAAGWTQCKKPEPTPEPTPKPCKPCHPCKPCKPTIVVVQPQVVCPKVTPSCPKIRDCDEVKVCGKNVQINLFSIVKNCIKN